MNVLNEATGVSYHIKDRCENRSCGHTKYLNWSGGGIGRHIPDDGVKKAL